jgi:hypothetical protein
MGDGKQGWEGRSVDVEGAQGALNKEAGEAEITFYDLLEGLLGTMM